MISTTPIALIAALHVYILVLEMFLWETPKARRAFGLSPEFARQTRTLAANQGLYNGFLAAGLLTGILLGADGDTFKVFFLICIGIAGTFGAFTASRKIVFVQTVPAILALMAHLLGV